MYDKGDVVKVNGYDSEQVITQDHEGDAIDVIHENEYGSVSIDAAKHTEGIVRNVFHEDDVIEKVDTVELNPN